MDAVAFEIQYQCWLTCAGSNRQQCQDQNLHPHFVSDFGLKWFQTGYLVFILFKLLSVHSYLTDFFVFEWACILEQNNDFTSKLHIKYRYWKIRYDAESTYKIGWLDHLDFLNFQLKVVKGYCQNLISTKSLLTKTTKP